MTTIETAELTPKETRNEFNSKPSGLETDDRVETFTSLNPDNGQQSQPVIASKKRKQKRRSKNDRTYSHIGVKSTSRKIEKITPSNSTLNSTLSYFPSLKLQSKTKNNSTLKNSNETQRSVMESSAQAADLNLSSKSPLGTHVSFFNRKAVSMPKRRIGGVDPEKDRLGREKLNKFQNRKHTDYQLNLLKNRIK